MAGLALLTLPEFQLLALGRRAGQIEEDDKPSRWSGAILVDLDVDRLLVLPPKEQPPVLSFFEQNLRPWSPNPFDFLACR